MQAKRAALGVMAKMALADGNVDDDERELLVDMAGGDGAALVDAAIADAKSQPLEQLAAAVGKYEDRFFVALRAYAVAHADRKFDVSEQHLFQRLAALFELTADDLRLIRRAEGNSHAIDPKPLDPRVEELFRNSSFAA